MRKSDAWSSGEIRAVFPVKHRKGRGVRIVLVFEGFVT